MGNMPEWFAKTPEMCASDRWFSVADAGDKGTLAQRYLDALAVLQGETRPYFDDSAALTDAAEDGELTLDAGKVHRALHSHFVGDWIHAGYLPGDPSTHALGGRYWPTIPSERVVSVIKVGTQAAILKALGETNLDRMGMDSNTIAELFVPEQKVGIDTHGIRPLATSWNCVAPLGSDFFHANALRGPSIVELAIATPKPYEVSDFGVTIDRAASGELSLSVPNFNFEIAPEE
jgi:hypothetical protein